MGWCYGQDRARGRAICIKQHVKQPVKCLDRKEFVGISPTSATREDVPAPARHGNRERDRQTSLQGLLLRKSPASTPRLRLTHTQQHQAQPSASATHTTALHRRERVAPFSRCAPKASRSSHPPGKDAAPVIHHTVARNPPHATAFPLSQGGTATTTATMLPQRALAQRIGSAAGTALPTSGGPRSVPTHMARTWQGRMAAPSSAGGAPLAGGPPQAAYAPPDSRQPTLRPRTMRGGAPQTPQQQPAPAPAPAYTPAAAPAPPQYAPAYGNGGGLQAHPAVTAQGPPALDSLERVAPAGQAAPGQAAPGTRSPPMRARTHARTHAGVHFALVLQPCSHMPPRMHACIMAAACDKGACTMRVHRSPGQRRRSQGTPARCAPRSPPAP